MPLTQAAAMIHRDRKRIRRACEALGIPLVRDSTNRCMLSAADVQRIAEYIDCLPMVVDSRGFDRYEQIEEERLRSNADLRDRIMAARRFKARSGGRLLTDAWLDAELAAMRQGVAG